MLNRKYLSSATAPRLPAHVLRNARAVAKKPGGKRGRKTVKPEWI